MFLKRGWLAFLIMWVSMSSLSLAQDESEELTPEEVREKFVLEKVMEELKFQFVQKALLKIDDLERFLELESGSLKKARILAKGAAKKKTTEVGGGVVGAMQRQINRGGEGATFSVNEKKFTFEGEEPEEKPYMRIYLDYARNIGRWQVRFDRRSSSGSVGRNRLPFLIEKEAGWRGSLGDVTDEQLEEYKQWEEKRGISNVQRGILSALSSDLRLNAEQAAEMNQWLEGKLKYRDNLSMVDNIKQSMKDASLFKDVPDFLTEVQKQKWQLIKNNPHPLGW